MLNKVYFCFKFEFWIEIYLFFSHANFFILCNLVKKKIFWLNICFIITISFFFCSFFLQQLETGCNYQREKENAKWISICPNFYYQQLQKEKRTITTTNIWFDFLFLHFSFSLSLLLFIIFYSSVVFVISNPINRKFFIYFMFRFGIKLYLKFLELIASQGQICFKQ